jgi:hypothetical protein
MSSVRHGLTRFLLMKNARIFKNYRCNRRTNSIMLHVIDCQCSETLIQACLLMQPIKGVLKIIQILSCRFSVIIKTERKVYVFLDKIKAKESSCNNSDIND